MKTEPRRWLLGLQALAFYFGLGLSTLVVAPLLLLAYPLGFQRRYALSKCWTGFNIWWLGLTCRVHYRLRGVENLPDEPVIVFAKHQSTWETLFLHWRLPPLAWVLKRELFWLPLFGWGLAVLEPIAINRNATAAAVAQILRQGKRYLDGGRWVLIFPEGTRCAPGQRRRYKSGGARLAAHSGYPVLPIAHNAGEYWRRRSFIKYPGTIDVVIGPLIPTTGLNAHQINAQAARWIEQTMQEISNRHPAPSEAGTPHPE